jgi:hypothetical protein
LKAGSQMPPVALSSIRSSSSRRTRNELGTMPLAVPECSGASSTRTVTVTATRPRRLFVSHSRE